MTGTLIEPGALKDVLKGILFSMLIIVVMYTMPIVGVFAWILLPLPILFYRLKIGRNAAGLIVLACLGVLISMSHNLFFSLMYFGSLLMTGFILGECIENHLPIEKVISYTCLMLFGACTILLFAYATTLGQSIDQFVSNLVIEYKTISADLFSQSASLYPNMTLDKQLYEQASELLMITFPGILFSTYMIVSLLNVILIRKLLLKNNIVVQNLENLNQWKSPNRLVVCLIGLLVLSFIPSDTITIPISNCLLIVMTIYFLHGMAVTSYFFKAKKAPIGVKVFFYTLIVLQPIVMLLVAGAGVFDTWIDFRKRDLATK